MTTLSILLVCAVVWLLLIWRRLRLAYALWADRGLSYSWRRAWQRAGDMVLP